MQTRKDMETSKRSRSQRQMATPEAPSFDESIEQLNALVEFSSKFSGNNKVTYDTLLIDDPFKRSDISKVIHKDYRDSVVTLIDEFESSLERLSKRTKFISREKVLKTYRGAIRNEIEESICKNEKHSMSKLDELYGAAQLEKDLKNSLNGDSSNSSDYNRREGSSEASRNKKRTSIPKETKAFLESIFNTKRTPNSIERQLIAEKCGLTPVQVRVWFTNKRMRTKEDKETSTTENKT